MSKGSNALIQQLLAAEAEAEGLVKKARENRVKKLKDAMVSAEEEIAIFKKKEEEVFQQEFIKNHGQEDTTQADLDEITVNEIKAVERDYKANKNNVVSFLVDRVLAVNLRLESVQKRYLEEGLSQQD